MSQVIFPGQLLFRDKVDAIYDVVGHMAPGLCLDVGAAAGKVTRRLAKVPGSRVTAFEPFAGNIEHFERNTAKFNNVRLVRSAVSDFDGEGRLFVSSTLQGSERGWEDYKGYSSSGMLVSETDRRWKDARSGSVPVVSLDRTISEPVRLLKIDVQGGEIGVLRGASGLLRDRAIDIVYIEFEGDGDTLELLASFDYELIDSGVYVYSPGPKSPPASKLSGSFVATTLSSGRQVFKGPLSLRPLPLDDYIAFIKSAGEWALQTDIVAVRRDVLGQFISACGANLS